MYKYQKPKETKKAETWKEKMADHTRLVNILQEKDRYLTPNEKQTYGEALMEDKHRIYESAIPGAAAEFSQAKQTYIIHDKLFKRAQSDEIKRWDGVKLAGEMQVAEMRLKSILKSNLRNDEKKAQIEALFNEAKKADDLHKLRAISEVLQGVASEISGDPMEKLPFNRLANEAAKTLTDIRITDAMIQAAENRAAAAEELGAKRDQLDEVASFFHGQNSHAGWEKSFVAAVAGVEFSVDGGRTVINITDNPDS